MPCMFLQLCLLIVLGPRHHRGDDTRVPVRLWDSYLDRAELGIVEATIPRSLLYLPQQLIEVSSPRRYLGCGRTSRRPYSPVQSQEGAEFRVGSESGLQSKSVPCFSTHCYRQILCVWCRSSAVSVHHRIQANTFLTSKLTTRAEYCMLVN